MADLVMRLRMPELQDINGANNSNFSIDASVFAVVGWDDDSPLVVHVALIHAQTEPSSEIIGAPIAMRQLLNLIAHMLLPYVGRIELQVRGLLHGEHEFGLAHLGQCLAKLRGYTEPAFLIETVFRPAEEVIHSDEGEAANPVEGLAPILPFSPFISHLN